MASRHTDDTGDQSLLPTLTLMLKPHAAHSGIADQLLPHRLTTLRARIGFPDAIIFFLADGTSRRSLPLTYSFGMGRTFLKRRTVFPQVDRSQSQSHSSGAAHRGEPASTSRQPADQAATSARPPALPTDAVRARPGWASALCCISPQDAAHTRNDPTSLLIAAYGLPVPVSPAGYSATAADEIQSALTQLGPPTRNHNATGRLFARAVIDGSASRFAIVMTLAKHRIIDLNQPFAPAARASMLLELVNKPDASRAGIDYPVSDFIAADARVTAMLANGANPDLPHFTGTLPLEYAWRQNTDTGNNIARALLQGGANALKLDSDGMNLLHRAVLGDDMNIIRNSLAAGVPADTLTGQGRVTPLMLAVYSNNLAAARVLLAGGANVIANGSGGHSPYSLALNHLDDTDDNRMAILLQQHAIASGIPEPVLEIVANNGR